MITPAILPICALIFASCSGGGRIRVAVIDIDVDACYPNPSDSAPFYEREKTGILYVRDGGREYLFVATDAVSPSRGQTDSIKASLAGKFGISADHIAIHANHNHQSRRFETACFLEKLLPAVEAARAAAVPAEIAHVKASAKNLIYNRRVFVSDGLGAVTLGHQFRAFNDTAKGTSKVSLQVFDYFSGVKTDREEYNFQGKILNADIKSLRMRSFLKEIREKNFYAGGTVDNRLEWLIFRRSSDHSPLGSLVRFSAHRSHCPQFLTRALSQATGGAPCFFVIGTAGSGGLLEFSDGGVYSEQKRVASMESIARRMADRLLSAREKTVFEPVRSTAWRQRTARLEVAEDIRRNRGRLKDLEPEMDRLYDSVRASECSPAEFKAARDRAGRGWAVARCDDYPDTLDIPFSVLRLNRTALLCVPGEMLEPIGEVIRERSGERGLLIAELCDDGRLAYVPHPDEFKHGGYEVINSRLSPAGVQALMDQAVALLRETPAR